MKKFKFLGATFFALFFAFAGIAQANTYVFYAPSGVGTFLDQGGNVRAPDANGMITVTDPNLVKSFVNAGFVLLVATPPKVTHDYLAAHADWTLSQAEAAARDFLVIDAATAGANAILPAGFTGTFHVKNTSGQTVTFKYASSTGVAVATAKQIILYADGGEVQTILAAY